MAQLRRVFFIQKAGRHRLFLAHSLERELLALLAIEHAHLFLETFHFVANAFIANCFSHGDSLS